MTQRTLGEWLAYLEQLHPSAIDMGLERSQQVAARLGLGRPAPRVVTVTGTNGKGSTCAFVAALLQAQGLKVGVYNSPHLLRYNERVQLNGVEATDAQLCEAFAALDAGRGEISLTYFEMGTLAAFWLFERAQLDALGLFVDPIWNMPALYVGVGVGILALTGGIWLGSVTFERRGPEMLASALRA